MNRENLGDKMQFFKDAVLKAVEAYNHFRSPEAKARLIKIGKSKLIVDFEGSFCRTCGVHDYLEDLIYELERFADVEIEVLSFENYEPEKIRVKYGVKSVSKH